MNYSEFYKRAEADEPTWKDTIEFKDKSGNPTGHVEGYPEQLPMLALLAGAGALGGYALSNKKKKGAGTLFGGVGLPALYLAYVAARRNKWLNGSDDILDRGAHKVNERGNRFNPLLSDNTPAKEEA